MPDIVCFGICNRKVIRYSNSKALYKFFHKKLPREGEKRIGCECPIAEYRDPEGFVRDAAKYKFRWKPEEEYNEISGYKREYSEIKHSGDPVQSSRIIAEAAALYRISKNCASVSALV